MLADGLSLQGKKHESRANNGSYMSNQHGTIAPWLASLTLAASRMLPSMVVSILVPLNCSSRCRTLFAFQLAIMLVRLDSFLLLKFRSGLLETLQIRAGLACVQFCHQSWLHLHDSHRAVQREVEMIALLKPFWL
eukprot:2551150-Amphidinium_carterae.1